MTCLHQEFVITHSIHKMRFHDKKRISLEYLPDIPSIISITINCVKKTRFNDISFFSCEQLSKR
jgi:hypothetical protein